MLFRERRNGYRGGREMKTFRRILFFALMAVMAAGLLVLVFHRSTSFLYFDLSIPAALGLLVWSSIFLKTEPDLTRISLVILIVFVAILFVLVGTSPD